MRVCDRRVPHSDGPVVERLTPTRSVSEGLQHTNPKRERGTATPNFPRPPRPAVLPTDASG